MRMSVARKKFLFVFFFYNQNEMTADNFQPPFDAWSKPIKTVNWITFAINLHIHFSNQSMPQDARYPNLFIELCIAVPFNDGSWSVECSHIFFFIFRSLFQEAALRLYRQTTFFCMGRTKMWKTTSDKRIICGWDNGLRAAIVQFKWN